MMRSPTVPADVKTMLAAVGDGLQTILGADLVGLYLRGSLALGDFIPATSDLDLLAVTDRPVDQARFTALANFHAQLSTTPNPYAKRLEITYLDRAAVRRYQPGQRHPTLGQGEILAWTEHGDNWLLERWAVREHGLVLYGPDPKTLIDPVSAAEIRAAVRTRLVDWVDWANDPDDPDWGAPRSHKAYVVETMCRILHTLASGELGSKRQAVAWALETLPEPWRSTVERSRAWRADNTVDPALIPAVRDFVLWTGMVGQTGGRRSG